MCHPKKGTIDLAPDHHLMFEVITTALGVARRRGSQDGYEAIHSPSASPVRGLSVDSSHARHARRRSSSLVGEAVPEDKVAWAHYILGAATLLSWNAMINATPYFQYRLTGSSLKPAFSSYLSSTSTVSGFFALAHATATSGNTSPSRRIHLASLTLLVLLLFITISPFISLSPNAFFFFTILNAILAAAASSYFQTAIVAVASLFGPFAIQAVFAGQAAVAVLISALQFTTAALSTARSSPSANLDEFASSDDDARVATSAFFFFAICSSFIGVAIFAHAWLVNMPAYKAVVKPFEVAKSGLVVEEDEEIEGEEPSVQSPDEERYLVGVEVQVPPTPQRVSIWNVAKLNAKYNFAVGFVFVVTLAVFPAITISIRSVHTSPDASPIFNPLLFNSLHFLLFNISDYLGRYMCTVPRFLIWSRGKLLTLSLLRMAFIPLFLACNVQRSTPSTTLTSPLINSDLVYLIILFVFGLSNGYISTLCMMAAPSIQHNPRLKKEQVDTAATVAQFFLTGGLAVGSIASFAVRSRICQCNPFIG